MTLKQIQELLHATVCIPGARLDLEVEYAFSADMMSDVLAFAHNNSVLLTGLVNTQVIRTAEIKDLSLVIFTRGKAPSDEISDLAHKHNLCVMSTEYNLFEASGILYANGLKA